MPAIQPAHDCLVTKVDAIGFDEASEQIARLMRVRYVQLERGAAHVKGAIARLHRVHLGRFGGDRNSIVWLDTPAGRPLLFVPVRGLARLGTASIEPHQAAVVGAATQVVAFADKNFLPICAAPDMRALAEVADDLKIAIAIPDKVRHVRYLRISPARLLGLDRLVREILQTAVAAAEQSCAAASLAALENDFLCRCAALLEHADAGDHGLARVVARRRAALRAREFIDMHLDQRLSLSQICRASYASARALTYGFREMFDLTPMAYVRFARMAQVRSELYLAPSHRRAITALARKWGFWHLGQFSKEYCALYGELPSQTLRRAPVVESARHAGRAAV